MTLANDAKFWDRTSRKYASGPVADQQAYARTLDRTRALLRPQDRVLELGCGTGSTALRLAGGVRSYLATDISAGMIEIAEEKLAADPVRGLSFRAATAEEFDPADAQFDVVLGFNYLHLVHDLPATLRQIHALLAANGALVTKTPCLGEMNPLLRLALPLARTLGYAPHTGVFTAAQLQAAIEAAGFAIEASERHASGGKDTRPYLIARKR